MSEQIKELETKLAAAEAAGAEMRGRLQYLFDIRPKLLAWDGEVAEAVATAFDTIEIFLNSPLGTGWKSPAEVAEMEARLKTALESLVAHRDQINQLTKERDEAVAARDTYRAELDRRDAIPNESNEWRTWLQGWGGTPEIVNDFIKGQQDRIYACQEIEKELSRLRSEIERKDAAISGVLFFFKESEDESPNEGFERVAEAFYRDTGFVMPGKDCILHDHDTRRKEYSKWHKSRIDALRAALAPAEKEAMTTKTRNAPVKTISEVCGSEPGAFADHLKEQSEEVARDQATVDAAMKQYRDLVPGVDRWQEGDEFLLGNNCWKETEIIGEVVEEFNAPGRRPLPEVPEGWTVNGDHIERVGDGSWLHSDGMQWHGVSGWHYVPSNLFGTSSVYGILFRLPWPPKQEAIAKAEGKEQG